MNISGGAPQTSAMDQGSGFSPGVPPASQKYSIVFDFVALLQQGAKFAWRKKWLVPLLYSQFWFAACFSLLAPFFPNLAAQKGILNIKFGIFFSVFKFFMLVGSFSAGKLIEKFGPVPLYINGLIGTFLFDICVGSLYWVKDPNVFLVILYPLAVCGGFLGCLYSVSMYSMVTGRFSRKPGLIIASMEFLWGIGNMIGTIIGGLLIELWGFPTPFFVLGVLTILFIPVIIRKGPITPSRNQTREFDGLQQSPESSLQQLGSSTLSSDLSKPPEATNYRKMILRPLFIIDMITVMFSWIVMSFNEPTLQSWLAHQFDLLDAGVGIVFCVQYASYAIGALLCGLMSALGQEELLLFLGQMCTAIAYLIIGPAPFIDAKPSMAFIYISQVLTGLGMAAQFVCGFAHALKISIQAGYPNTVKTSGVIASTTFVFMVLGAILTPPTASFLVDKYQYRKGTMFIFFPLVAWSLVNLTVFIRSCLKKS